MVVPLPICNVALAAPVESTSSSPEAATVIEAALLNVFPLRSKLTFAGIVKAVVVEAVPCNVLVPEPPNVNVLYERASTCCAPAPLYVTADPVPVVNVPMEFVEPCNTKL